MSVAPALLLFLVLHGIFFPDVLFDGRTLSAASLTAGLTPSGPLDAPADLPPPHLLDVEGAAWVDEPSPYLARRAFAAGELPLWSPGSGLGTPFAANLNSGAGNPLQLALNLAPSPLHADAFYMVRLLILACATWAFLRELRLGTSGALLGAALVTYGGYPLAWIAHHPLSTEVFLPVMLLGFERGRGGRAGGWALVVIGAAAAVLGGKLQAALLCFAFVGVWSCARASIATGGRGLSTVIATLVGLALGNVVAAFLLLPAFETMAHASGLTLGGRSQLASFVVPWWSLVSLAAPGLFVAPGKAFADGLMTPSIGVAAIVFAAVACMARGAPLRRMACVAVAWAVVLLLRNAGAFADLTVALPVFRAILFVKYTFTIVFALAVAAAIGADAVAAGRVDPRSVHRAFAAAVLAAGVLAGAALVADRAAIHPGGILVPVGAAFVLAGALAAWRVAGLARSWVAAVGVFVALAELYAAAPHAHPPRLDPYRAPPYVTFLRDAAPGRIVADPDLAVPLTSAAAGLRDLRAIDVLTPGASYAFFTRLVSFCDRVIHFTVDPDVTLAATSPAADLANVRWVVTRQPLAFDDLAPRVARQVGRERTARLLAGMTSFRTIGGPLAIGPVAVAGSERFAFTLPTPFTLDVTAVSEAPELAFGVLVRGQARAVRLRTIVEGVASDAGDAPETMAAEERWQESRIALGRAGEARRIRARIEVTAIDGAPATVSLGDLGFGPGAATETRLAAERAARHETEAGALREVFRDSEIGAIVYENGNVLPRAFRVRTVEPTGAEDAALTRLGDGFDFRTSALVEKRDVSTVSAALAMPRALAAGEGTTVVRAETPSSVTLATDGPTAALVVLSDLAYPGWRADVDGGEAPVHVVDGVFRGVVVPAGSHVLTFRYRPTSWLVGLALTVLGITAVVPFARGAGRRHAGAANG